MKKTKLEKGITLIALIITIVVLLILAAVTIGVIQESKIIAHAKNASTGYNDEKAKEESAIAGYEGLIDKYANPISVSDLYWYEENEDGGITILGPKKIWLLDEEKSGNKVLELMVAEYGEETINAYLNETLEDEDLNNEIAIKGEIEFVKMEYDFSNSEYWTVREFAKEDLIGAGWFNRIIGYTPARLYNTEKLPEYIDGKPVTKIADYAFEYIYVINGEFIPNTVTYIGEHAFRRSLFESQLIIPDSVINIASSAFYSLSSRPNFDLGLNDEGSLQYENITLVINDAKGNLVSIGAGAFSSKDGNNPLIGTLTLRSEIDIASNAFESGVTVNRK